MYFRHNVCFLMLISEPQTTALSYKCTSWLLVSSLVFFFCIKTCTFSFTVSSSMSKCLEQNGFHTCQTTMSWFTSEWGLPRAPTASTEVRSSVQERWDQSVNPTLALLTMWPPALNLSFSWETWAIIIVSIAWACCKKDIISPVIIATNSIRWPVSLSEW